MGLQVSRLKRVRYGTVTLASTHRLGTVKELPEKAVIELAESVGLAYSKSAAADAAPRRGNARSSVSKFTDKNSSRAAKKPATARSSSTGKRALPASSRTAKTKRRS